MPFQILPVELANRVVHYLTTADLVALSTANSWLYLVIQRSLYRHMTINYSSNNLAIVSTLAQNPHLACHVRTFAIRLGTATSPFYHLLRTALSNMSELTSLDIFLDHSASWIMRTRDNSTYHCLERFASSFHLDHNVTHFLHKTNALLELEVDSLPPPDFAPDLKANALPMLSQFSGSTQVAQYVVPGRPVESIHLNSGDLTEDAMESLTKSTAHVLLLAAETAYHSVALIRTLTQCMNHLVHLRIATAFSFSEPPNTPYFINISNALRSLPDLRTCEIWGTHWVSCKNDLHDEGRVWESEPFNQPEDHPDNLYSDIWFAI